MPAPIITGNVLWIGLDHKKNTLTAIALKANQKELIVALDHAHRGPLLAEVTGVLDVIKM